MNMDLKTYNVYTVKTSSDILSRSLLLAIDHDREAVVTIYGVVGKDFNNAQQQYLFLIKVAVPIRL